MSKCSPRCVIPQPDRVRKIQGSFAWIDHRLLRDGFLAAMTREDQALYLFLALAADRNGVSFYRKEKICDLLWLDEGQFVTARERLIDMGLIGFQPYSAFSPNGWYQILPVEQPAPTIDRPVVEPATVRPSNDMISTAPQSEHERARSSNAEPAQAMATGRPDSPEQLARARERFINQMKQLFNPDKD